MFLGNKFTVCKKNSRLVSRLNVMSQIRTTKWINKDIGNKIPKLRTSSWHTNVLSYLSLVSFLRSGFFFVCGKCLPKSLIGGEVVRILTPSFPYGGSSLLDKFFSQNYFWSNTDCIYASQKLRGQAVYNKWETNR